MKITFLPHKFKRIALALFLLVFITDFFWNYDENIAAFRKGYEDGRANRPFGGELEKVEFSLPYVDILLFASMFLYAFSKEKIEDEFLYLKRYEAFMLSFNICVCLTVFLFFCGFHTLKTVLILPVQLAIYLIVFYFKKREI